MFRLGVWMSFGIVTLGLGGPVWARAGQPDQSAESVATGGATPSSGPGAFAEVEAIVRTMVARGDRRGAVAVCELKLASAALTRASMAERERIVALTVGLLLQLAVGDPGQARAYLRRADALQRQHMRAWRGLVGFDVPVRAAMVALRRDIVAARAAVAVENPARTEAVRSPEKSSGTSAPAEPVHANREREPQSQPQKDPASRRPPIVSSRGVPMFVTGLAMGFAGLAGGASMMAIGGYYWRENPGPRITPSGRLVELAPNRGPALMIAGAASMTALTTAGLVLAVVGAQRHRAARWSLGVTPRLGAAETSFAARF